MRPIRQSFLVFLCGFIALSQPAFAKRIKALKMEKVEDKTLEGTDNSPKWTKEDVKVFCEGRSKTIHQDKQQCENLRSKDVGHIISIAEMQELEEFRKSASKSVKKGVGRSKKGGKKAAGKATKKHMKTDHTIVQPPLPSSGK